MLKHLLTIGIILTATLFTPQSAMAVGETEACAALNNRDILACPGGPMPQESEDGQDIRVCPPASESANPAFNQYIVVITETPLGGSRNASNAFGGQFAVVNCARQIKCEITDEDYCYAEYMSIAECGSEDNRLGSAQYYCEYVQAYIAPDGHSLVFGFLSFMYQYFAGLGGLIAVITIIIAGIMRTTAGNNTEQVSKSTQLITRALTGLVILLLSSVILYIINPNFFTLTNPEPTGSTPTSTSATPSDGS